jgi:hypothetical protein
MSEQQYRIMRRFYWPDGTVEVKSGYPHEIYLAVDIMEFLRSILWQTPCDIWLVPA